MELDSTTVGTSLKPPRGRRRRRKGVFRGGMMGGGKNANNPKTRLKRRHPPSHPRKTEAERLREEAKKTMHFDPEPLRPYVPRSCTLLSQSPPSEEPLVPWSQITFNFDSDAEKEEGVGVEEGPGFENGYGPFEPLVISRNVKGEVGQEDDNDPVDFHDGVEGQCEPNVGPDQPHIISSHSINIAKGLAAAIKVKQEAERETVFGVYADVNKTLWLDEEETEGIVKCVVCLAPAKGEFRGTGTAAEMRRQTYLLLSECFDLPFQDDGVSKLPTLYLCDPHLDIITTVSECLSFIRNQFRKSLGAEDLLHQNGKRGSKDDTSHIREVSGARMFRSTPTPEPEPRAQEHENENNEMVDPLATEPERQPLLIIPQKEIVFVAPTIASTSSSSAVDRNPSPENNSAPLQASSITNKPVAPKKRIHKSRPKPRPRPLATGKFRCESCGERWETRPFLEHHIRHCKWAKIRRGKKVVLEENEQRMENGDWRCQLCGAEYVTRFALRDHLLSKSLTALLKCCFCTASFTSPLNLKQHQVHNHKDLFKYACDLCGRKFAVETEIRGHKRYKCPNKEKKKMPPLTPEYLLKLGF